MAKIDQFDARILNLVQRDNRLTSEQLAEVVGLSAAACQRRLRRLREERVIRAEVAIVAPEAVGQAVWTVILIALKRADLIKEFTSAVIDRPEVMSAFRVTGDTDFVLIATARDMPSYKDFLDHLSASSTIRTYKSLVVIDGVKVGFAVPVQA